MGRKTRSRPKQGGPLARWRELRRARRDARALIKEVRRVLRKHGAALKEDVRAAFDAALAALKAAYAERDAAALELHGETLDELLDRHLAFARKSALREYVESIGVAVLIALVLRALVIEAFKIPSGSMIPTLKIGDHIFVNKFIYGVGLPFIRGKFFARPPTRGDVVVFLYPQDVDKGFFDQKDFIKRVVAVGGDRIAVQDGTILLNGRPVARRKLSGECSFVDPGQSGDEMDPKPCIAYEEELEGNRYRVIQGIYGRATDYPETTIPAGHVFVMGDNRDNSSDSREWGLVPLDLIKGKAMIIWWSRGAPDGVRWGRFFGRVHAAPSGSSVTP